MEFMDKGIKQTEDKAVEYTQMVVDRNKELEKEREVNEETIEKLLELAEKKDEQMEIKNFAIIELTEMIEELEEEVQQLKDALNPAEETADATELY